MFSTTDYGLQTTDIERFPLNQGIMYYPYFLAYMTIGFFVSLLVFFLSLRRGQFKDQERARFLPLNREEERESCKRSRASRVEVAALIFLACAGLSASAAVVVFALLRAH